MYKVILKITEMAQKYISGVVRAEDTVVDATLGNGWDSLFLSTLVPGGRVYAFEVQSQAIINFESRSRTDEINNITVINEGHENMDKYVATRPRAIMFNLGYLPGGGEQITTLAHTTIQAVEKGLRLLLPGGIMTICVYTGHEEGKKEETAVMEFLKGLSSKKYSAMSLNYVNKSSNPPYLIVIEKNDNWNEDTRNNLG